MAQRTRHHLEATSTAFYIHKPVTCSGQQATLPPSELILRTTTLAADHMARGILWMSVHSTLRHSRTVNTISIKSATKKARISVGLPDRSASSGTSLRKFPDETEWREVVRERLFASAQKAIGRILASNSGSCARAANINTFCMGAGCWYGELRAPGRGEG